MNKKIDFCQKLLEIDGSVSPIFLKDICFSALSFVGQGANADTVVKQGLLIVKIQKGQPLVELDSDEITMIKALLHSVTNSQTVIQVRDLLELKENPFLISNNKKTE